MEPTRRFVDADNACLFSSIGYLIDPKNFNETTKHEYRMMIVNYLRQGNVDDNILDLPRDEYIKEIEKPSKWGGAIELKIFSDMFQIQIASIDIKTNRADIYGEDKDYSQRIFVIYNGIHYDPLVLSSPEVEEDEEIEDVTKFGTNDDSILIEFKEYCKIYQNANEYVDVNDMTKFECDTCQTIFDSQKEAFDHANEFQHFNLNELI